MPSWKFHNLIHVNKCSARFETRVKSDEPPWLHRLTNKNYQSNCPGTVLLRKKLTILFIFYAQPKNYTTSGSHVNVQHGLRPVSNQMSRLDCTQWDQIAKIRQKYGLKIVKLTDHTYAYNSWTYFKYEMDIMTGDRNDFC